MENCDADNTKNGEESIPLEAIQLINKIIETTKNLLIKRKKKRTRDEKDTKQVAYLARVNEAYRSNR